MIRRNSLALVLLALASLHASADILLDGYKRIEHTIVVDNLADHPDLAFFTFVTHLNYAAPIFPAKPLDIGNGNPMNGIYVVGIPRCPAPGRRTDCRESRARRSRAPRGGRAVPAGRRIAASARTARRR